MKVIYCKCFPPKGYAAINLFGIIIARKQYAPVSERTIRHEAIHTAQMIELLYLFFYLWYGIEYLARFISGFLSYITEKGDTPSTIHAKAYQSISFEKEAYANEDKMNYCKQRTMWKFLKYM